MKEAPFLARSLTLVPRSLLLNRTEMLRRLHVCENQSVWKGICKTRDFANLLRGLRVNTKYPDGIRDFTATRGSGFAKIWGRDVRYFFLSVENS